MKLLSVLLFALFIPACKPDKATNAESTVDFGGTPGRLFSFQFDGADCVALLTSNGTGLDCNRKYK